ncbi:MAG: phenylacetate-CoA oxygenase subunit PaaC [Flavobacteriales bacterium]|nr:phenylacetate-CoA oxygenase subunit PaaC [Flavobacteriales bacterium]
MSEQEALFDYCLRLGDSSLIVGHRLSEWCGHGPILEEDIAIINVSLDLVGQARTVLAYGGKVEGKGRSEDDLAYLRDVKFYRNHLICEQPNGDYGRTIVRQFLFDSFHYFFLKELVNSTDEFLAAYAEKSLKEVTYHLQHSTKWMLRLGDGTEESHKRVQEPLDDLWRFTGEFFQINEVDEVLVAKGIAVDLTKIQPLWEQLVKEVIEEATLIVPTNDWKQFGGKEGRHTEHLGFILAQMQFLPRAYPDAKW